MTMPHLMNCSHHDSGWCLDCVKELYDQKQRNAGRGEPIDSLELAARFHDSYERLAPSFGYETRPDTKVFDADSKNGRLMVAVCGEMLSHLRKRNLNADRATPTSKSERDKLQLIDERDKAEEAMSQAYYLVTGRSPEWSNNFGYDQALEDIKDAVNLYKAAIKSAPSATPAVAEAGDTWPTISLSKEQVEQVNKGLAMLADVPHPSPESGEPDPAKAEAGEKRFAESWAYLNDSEKCDNQHQEILFLRVAVRHLIAELRKGAGK